MRSALLATLLIIVLGQAGCETGPDAESTAGKDAPGTLAPDSIPVPRLQYSFAERQGRSVYDRYCVVCHGEGGEGDGFNAFNLDPRPKSLADSSYMDALSDESLVEIISFGGRGVNKSVLMPAYQNTLTRDQIRYVVEYIRTFVPSGDRP